MLIGKILSFGLGLVIGIVSATVVFLIIYFTSLQCPKSSSSSDGLQADNGVKTSEIIKIAVLNFSEKSTDEVLDVVEAVQRQVHEDFAPIWDVNCSLEYFSDPNSIPEPYWLLFLYNDADQESALGYHTLDNNGEPIMKVFVKTAESYGIPWSLTFSHEVLETLIDPYAASCIFIQDPNDPTKGIILSLEVCDPCQDSSHGYEMITNSGRKVLLSDFVYPSWFAFYESTGPFDKMGHCQESLSVLNGGYVLLYQIPNDGSSWITYTPEMKNEGEVQNSQSTQMVRKGVAKVGRSDNEDLPIVLCDRARAVVKSGKKISMFNMKHPKKQ